MRSVEVTALSTRPRKPSLRTATWGLSVFAVLAFPLLLAPRISLAVLATNQGATAARNTSTQNLTPAELTAFELQGEFRGFLGTPIDDTHFITAQHIGILITDTITFNSGPNAGSYTVSSWDDDPGSDLRIVMINETFISWAPLFGSPDESLRTAIIFGRGGAPKAAISVLGELKGWSAIGGDGQISWGRNVVSGTLGPDQIFARFESNGLTEEAGLSIGDSGGAWFVQDAQGLTRLAGISYAVTGPFQDDVSGSPNGFPFEAALFDIGGLWVGNLGNEVFIPENPVNVPGVGIATRISDALPWIGTIIPISPVDTDADGVVNDFDNCPFAANPGQEDTGGLGFGSTEDGIGDVCQCGDVTGEGQVNDTDAAFIKREALGLAAPLFLVPDNCDVTGDGQCTGTDATLIRHAAIGAVSPFFGQNCPSAMP